jgi:hypothetical protein
MHWPQPAPALRKSASIIWVRSVSLYKGLAVIGGGAILGGLCSARSRYSSSTAIHQGGSVRIGGRGPHLLRLHAWRAIGVAQSPLVAIGYLMIGGLLFGCAKYAAVTPKPAEMSDLHDGITGRRALIRTRHLRSHRLLSRGARILHVGESRARRPSNTGEITCPQNDVGRTV